APVLDASLASQEACRFEAIHDAGGVAARDQQPLAQRGQHHPIRPRLAQAAQDAELRPGDALFLEEPAAPAADGLEAARQVPPGRERGGGADRLLRGWQRLRRRRRPRSRVEIDDRSGFHSELKISCRKYLASKKAVAGPPARP